MYVLNMSGKVPSVKKIEKVEEFEELNIPGFTYLVKAEPDLHLVPLTALVRIHNLARPKDKILKFSDHTAADKRVWPLIQELGETAMPTPELKPSESLKAQKEQKKPTVKRFGVISNFFSMARDKDGITIKEAVRRLKKVFPERDEKSMERTCRINIKFTGKKHKNYLPGEHFTKRKEEERGTVYQIVRD